MNSSVADIIDAAQEGDQEAMSRLVEENTPLIWSVVRRFFGRGVEPDDLFQLGSIGFIKAVKGFSREYGTQFSTYAVPKIAGEIKRFLRDDGMIKVSRTIKENAAKVYAARDAFEKKNGYEPRVSDIIALTGLTEEDIVLCQQASTDAASLDAETGEEGFSLMSALGTTRDEERLVERISLHDAIEALEDMQRAVIMLRYFRDLTQQKTADVLGISQVQVSRIEKKAVESMRAMVNSE